MHDQTMLQLIEDDIAPAEQLLDLLNTEAVALHGRDMVVLETILAHKQALIVLLDQHGRKRSQLLASMNLTPDRDGLVALSTQSHLGDALIERGDQLSHLLEACQQANDRNGKAIQLQQLTTANQIRILMGGEAPSLYTNRGSTARLANARPLSQA